MRFLCFGKMRKTCCINVSKALPSGWFYRWLQTGPHRLLCPQQHQASSVKHAAAALGRHDAAALPAHAPIAAAADADEGSAAAAAAAAAPQAGPDPAVPTGSSRSTVASPTLHGIL